MFYERLKKLREHMNLSREQLAKSLDISYSALSKYETGKRQPDFETLLKFAEHFGVSTDYLLTGIEVGQLSIFENESGTFEDSIAMRFPIRLKKTMEYRKISSARLAALLETTEEEVNSYLNIPTPLGFYHEHQIKYVEKIALILDVPADYLLGSSKFETKLYSPIINKHEQDIAKRLEQFREELENTEGLAFDGEPMSDEAKESLLESMELLFKQTQRINKKFTPKKYRENE